MQIVIGGAYNGKRKWVKEKIKDLDSKSWFDLKKDNKEIDLNKIKELKLVFSGIEEWTKGFLENKTMDEARDIAREWIQTLILWESEKESRQIILIANDISKGIVPIEKEDREWRDLTGWFYQDLFKEAERVDEIWYGIPRQLK